MKTSLIRASALACALYASTALVAPAQAQSVPPPKFVQVDANGVDLTSGDFFFSVTEGSIGSGEGAVSLVRTYAGKAGRVDNWSGRLYRRTTFGNPLIYVELGGISDTFTISGSAFTSTKGDGATLVSLPGGGYRYTAADGTQIEYISSVLSNFTLYPVDGPQCQLADPGTCAIPVSVKKPNGMTFTLNWDIVEHCEGYDEFLQCVGPKAFFRFDGVTSSANYSFSTDYLTDNPGGFSAPVPDWYKKTGAVFTNLTSPPPSPPTVSYSYPSAGVEEMTDSAGRAWRFTSGSGTFAIRRPGASADTTTVSMGSNGVTSVTKEGVTTAYQRITQLNNVVSMTITDALNHDTVVLSDASIGRPTSITDPLNRTTGFTYDANGRLKRVTLPEGNYVEYSYDSRGNVTQTQRVAKPGSSDPAIVTSASFDASCANPVKCNKPNSSTDARGKVTDYSYDSVHGGLLTVTAPVQPNGIRPQTRYSYSQVTAVSGQPISLPTGVSACQTTASCAGTADEAKTTITYNTTNLLPVSISSGSGNGALTATRTMTYDSIGNMLTVDGPLAGSDDTTRYRYNAAREVIGTVAPDPDAGGSLKHRAVRRTIDSQGLVTRVEAGTVDSQSDAHWAAFAPLQAVEIGYDAHARPITQKLVDPATGTIHALTQAGYDALGRPECVAQRMDPADFASTLPAACTLTSPAGSHGPDRIVKTLYTAAGDPDMVISAYGVAGEQALEQYLYTSNGRLAALIDAKNNRTSFEYNGQDRLARTTYPTATSGTGNVNPADYEHLIYDAAGNVASFRNRAGETTHFSYDNLGRLTLKDAPGTEPDVSYGHDNLGRLTSASQPGHALTFAYDALGRQLTETGPLGTVSSQYDLAGRRTRLTLPGSGLFVDYDHLLTGEVTRIRENGATSGVGVLATFGYDDLGRRTSLVRSNGNATGYGYDSASRLDTLAHDNDGAGTSHDVTLGFDYNPAGQIVSNSRSNDAYSYAPANESTASTANGLNQLTQVGSVAPSYDAKGNLTSDGATSFAYDSENRLISATGAKNATLTYDPLGRLYSVFSGGVSRYSVHDGIDRIAEYNGFAALLRRYVHGPGMDEPLVWYEGSSTSDRRFLHADERGSVIAVSDDAGNAIAVNKYDEYGVPQGGTIAGTFGYTGQAWMPELGLYHYKARAYDAKLGRFLQPDPIGYAAGMNLYAYVGNDPVNWKDPAGLCRFTLWGRFRHNEDWSEAELLFTWVEQDSPCDNPGLYRLSFGEDYGHWYAFLGVYPLDIRRTEGVCHVL